MIKTDIIIYGDKGSGKTLMSIVFSVFSCIPDFIDFIISINSLRDCLSEDNIYLKNKFIKLSIIILLSLLFMEVI